jgi:hypothetical protein
MVLHLAERLDVSLRERNRLLLAAGFAPAYPEHALDDAAMEAARMAIELVLHGHDRIRHLPWTGTGTFSPRTRPCSDC